MTTELASDVPDEFDGDEWIDSVFVGEEAEEDLDALLAGPIEVIEEELMKAPEEWSGSLDELLAESVGAITEAQEVAAMKVRVGKDSGGLSEGERVELQARIDTWEMANVWRKVASVAVFHRVICKSCEKVTESFRHFMQRCEGRKDVGMQRWYRVAQYDWHLPREVIFTEMVVELCAECACYEGWNLGEGEVKAHGEF